MAGGMPPLVLASVNVGDPVFWAVLVGWVLSVVLHEFAHGLVGTLGGDYTIRQRGGLTLNPLQYVHPVNSIVLPIVLLLMGGVPLPGGATYVRHDLLRSRAWATAVSLAGPAMNFVLFGLLLLPLHPRFGWLHPTPDGSGWTPLERFLAALGTLQFLTGVFNLIPCPPLDGFGALRPYLPTAVQAAARGPWMANLGLVVVFVAASAWPGLFQAMYEWERRLLRPMGLGPLWQGIATAFNGVMFGGS